MMSKLQFSRCERAVSLAAAVVGILWMASSALAQPAPVSAGPPDPKLIEDLVAASRILADHGLLDGWGHVSVRHNRDSNRYLMSRGLSADLVTAKDIIEFDLDSRPVDTHGLPMSGLFTERYIHGEIYKLRPDVMAIVHTHAPSLIPFGVTKIPLQPMYHRSAFISFGIPVFEIRDKAGMTDMLIRNSTLGHDLADVLGDHPAALMRGHGAVITGPSLPRVVGRTIFLALNATLQAEAMNMGAPITYMDPEEARKIEAREGHGLARTWEGWKQKVMGKP
ncbi:MAG TPA: class II aldolase/adducin family protein [Pseudolabrys sp.]|jgi:HCOMODA/2-hydroxy-3-carboxy-muconic semialdehyde decarboxylase|nr:class II aldolase/adducin family protein [Pseudolabrys sp.]